MFIDPLLIILIVIAVTIALAFNMEAIMDKLFPNMEEDMIKYLDEEAKKESLKN